MERVLRILDHRSECDSGEIVDLFKETFSSVKLLSTESGLLALRLVH